MRRVLGFLNRWPWINSPVVVLSVYGIGVTILLGTLPLVLQSNHSPWLTVGLIFGAIVSGISLITLLASGIRRALQYLGVRPYVKRIELTEEQAKMLKEALTELGQELNQDLELIQSASSSQTLWGYWDRQFKHTGWYEHKALIRALAPSSASVFESAYGHLNRLAKRVFSASVKVSTGLDSEAKAVRSSDNLGGAENATVMALEVIRELTTKAQTQSGS